MATIEDLSPELLVKIFSYFIDSKDHMQFSRNVVPVCREWWRLSRTPSLWKNIRVQNLNFVKSLSSRGLMYHTQCLTIPGTYRSSFDSDLALAVLSNIRDLKSLEIKWYYVDAGTMNVIAEHCPNLERLCLQYVSLPENAPITFLELRPILSVCGPKLKHLNLSLVARNSEQIVSEIAAKCTSLKVFEWDSFKFPIYEVMRGCPLLRKLKVSYCELVATGGNSCSGFEELTAFVAYQCDFRGLDLCSLLKNSNNLEHLQLSNNANMVVSDVSKLPSNKVEFLEHLWLQDMDMNCLILKQAVEKWKKTLLHLTFLSENVPQCNSVLKIYLDGNSCPKLEYLNIRNSEFDFVDLTFLKTFIEQCKNLKQLKTSLLHYEPRKEIMKFLDSI